MEIENHKKSLNKVATFFIWKRIYFAQKHSSGKFSYTISAVGNEVITHQRPSISALIL